jgi:hypothetical protein
MARDLSPPRERSTSVATKFETAPFTAARVPWPVGHASSGDAKRWGAKRPTIAKPTVIPLTMWMDSRSFADTASLLTTGGSEAAAWAIVITSPVSKGCVGRCRFETLFFQPQGTLGTKGRGLRSFRMEIVRSEMPLQSRLEEDVFAEVAAINMAIVKAMGLLASVATDRRPYLSRLLEAGLLDFKPIDYPNIPERRRAAFRRKVKASYASLLRAIP